MNAEARKIYNKQYYEKNKEKLLKYQKKYRDSEKHKTSLNKNNEKRAKLYTNCPNCDRRVLKERLYEHRHKVFCTTHNLRLII